MYDVIKTAPRANNGRCYMVLHLYLHTAFYCLDHLLVMAVLLANGFYS